MLSVQVLQKSASVSRCTNSEIDIDMKFQPLADRIRPTTLGDVVGQPHIL